MVRSVDWHLGLWWITSLLKRIKDPAFRAPRTNEHPRHGFAAVNTPWLTGERESSKDGSVMDPSAGTILVIWCVDPVAEALTAALGVWTGRWRVVVRPAITRAPCARKISIFLEIFLKKRV
jgi:hypothetical protein